MPIPKLKRNLRGGRISCDSTKPRSISSPRTTPKTRPSSNLRTTPKKRPSSNPRTTPLKRRRPLKSGGRL